MKLDLQKRDWRVVLCIAATLLAALGVAGLAHAQASVQDRPDNAGGRFVFHRAGEDLLRLDRTSGEVSSCVKQDAGWACYAVADERAALDAEIERLRIENARLKDTLLSRNIPLPGREAAPTAGANTMPADKPSKKTAGAGSSSDTSIEIRGPGIDRIQEFASAAWKRVVELFRDVR